MSFLNKKLVTLQYAGRSKTLELLKIDATRIETHIISMRVTEHEVEDGGNISDHVIRNGDTLTIEGTISDNPISLVQAGVGNLSGVVGSIVGGFAGAVVTGVGSKIGSSLLEGDTGKRSILAMSAFEFAQREAIPLIIITGLKTYTNMILEELSVPRTSRNSNALEFTAKFKNVRIVESETVTVPLSSLDPDAENATKKRNEGKKSTQPPGAKESEKGASLLSQLTGAGA